MSEEFKNEVESFFVEAGITQNQYLELCRLHSPQYKRFIKNQYPKDVFLFTLIRGLHRKSKLKGNEFLEHVKKITRC